MAEDTLKRHNENVTLIGTFGRSGYQGVRYSQPYRRFRLYVTETFSQSVHMP